MAVWAPSIPPNRIHTLETLPGSIERLKRRLSELEAIDQKDVAATQALRERITSTLGQVFAHGSHDFGRFHQAAIFWHELPANRGRMAPAEYEGFCEAEYEKQRGDARAILLKAIAFLEGEYHELAEIEGAKADSDLNLKTKGEVAVEAQTPEQVLSIVEALDREARTMYESPTKSDLDRNLSTILHDAHQKARAEAARLMSEFESRGMGLSSSLIGTTVGVLDDIHKDALKRAAPILRDFAERMQVAPSEIANIARPHLENMGNSVLGLLPSIGAADIANFHQQIRNRYQLVFQQRLNGALRDFEIGFSGGRSFVSKDTDDRSALAPSKDTQAEMLILKPTISGMGIDLKEAARRLKKLWQRGK
jgi:hypothetical protein